MNPNETQAALANAGIPTVLNRQSFRISSDDMRWKAVSAIKDIQADGTWKVTISKSAGKSARQRGLQWTWYRDVVRSGMGGRDEADEHRLDLVSKFRWCLPIKLREDDFFAELYAMYKAKHGDDKDRMMWFVETKVHTEELDSSQMAEFLTSFQRYYLGEGFPLSDPEDLLK